MDRRIIGCAVVATAAPAADPAQALKAKGWAVGAEGADVTQLIAPRAPKEAATADRVAAPAQFPKLKGLRHYGAGVADDSLTVLDKLPELRELIPECPNVTDATATRMRSQTGLTELSLDGGGFTAAGYEQLPVFEKLTKLHLDGRIAAPAVARLPVKFPNAEQLFFNNPRGFSGVDFAPLAQMKRAEWIVLSGSPTLMDAAADTLAKMPSLRKIEVGRVGHFTDKWLIGHGPTRHGRRRGPGIPRLAAVEAGRTRLSRNRAPEPGRAFDASGRPILLRKPRNLRPGKLSQVSYGAWDARRRIGTSVPPLESPPCGGPSEPR